MKKENVYIDLSKCTEQERKHIFSLLPNDEITAQIYYMIRDMDWEVLKAFSHLSLNENSLWQLYSNRSTKTYGKTELTYHEFIKLFESGEYNNGWIKIESEADLPKETIECRTCFYDGKNYVLGNTGERNSKQLWNAYKSIQITHYQPIQKPLPPKF